MPGSVIVTIDGVLADQQGEASFAASKPITEGVLLYRALVSVAKVSLVSLQSREDATKVEYWLKSHNLRDHVQLLYDPDPRDPDRGVKLVIDEVRRAGALDFAVEADPSRSARFVHHGVLTMVVARPHYTRPEFRPGSESTARPWEQVIEELDAQQGLSADDDRVTAEVAGGRYVE